MGSVGDAFDGTKAENGFASLGCELIYRRSFKTKTEARQAVFTWIEAWYNTRRRLRGSRHAGRGQPCAAPLLDLRRKP